MLMVILPNVILLGEILSSPFSLWLFYSLNYFTDLFSFINLLS